MHSEIGSDFSVSVSHYSHFPLFIILAITLTLCAFQRKILIWLVCLFNSSLLSCMQHIYVFSLRIYNYRYMLSYANSMTAPIIPSSAIQYGETDMQVTGLLVHISHCSFRRFSFVY